MNKMPEATVRLNIEGRSADFIVGERVIAESDDGEFFIVRAPTGSRIIVGVPAKYLTIDDSE